MWGTPFPSYAYVNGYSNHKKKNNTVTAHRWLHHPGYDTSIKTFHIIPDGMFFTNGGVNLSEKRYVIYATCITIYAGIHRLALTG